MTAKELAEILSGREVGEEIIWGEERDIKDAGLVVVYGYSDDNVELCGAINDEVGRTMARLSTSSLTAFSRNQNVAGMIAPTLPRNGKRPKPSRPCGMTRAPLAGRSRRTSPTRRSPSWRTGSRSVWG